MKYYSIRVVEANNLNEAIQKVKDGEFQDDDELCDSVLEAKRIKEHFDNLKQ